MGCHALLQGIFLTLGSFSSPALTGGFFHNRATWETLSEGTLKKCSVHSVSDNLQSFMKGLLTKGRAGCRKPQDQCYILEAVGTGAITPWAGRDNRWMQSAQNGALSPPTLQPPAKAPSEPREKPEGALCMQYSQSSLLGYRGVGERQAVNLEE